MSDILPPFIPTVGGAGGTPMHGVGLQLYPSDRTFEIEIQVAAAASSDSTVPKTTTATRLALKLPGVTKHTHFIPNDDDTRHYRARHRLEGYTPSDWTGWVASKAAPVSGKSGGTPDDAVGGGQGEDGDEIEPFIFGESRRRHDTFYSDDQRLQNVVRVRDDSGDFELNRHNESGFAQHTDAVVFADDFEAPPRITFVPQRAKVYSNSSDLGSTALGSTAGQYMDIAAESLTVSGFTLRAVLATSQAVTSFIDGWSTAQNTTSPEDGDVTLTADGDVAYSNLENADISAAATYRGFFGVDTSLMSPVNQLTVQLGFNSASTSTSFTLGASRNYGSGVSSTNEELNVLTALGSSYDLRLRIAYSSAPAPAEAATVTGYGEDAPQPGVEFDQIAGGVEESMTPLTGQKILWQATETP